MSNCYLDIEFLEGPQTKRFLGIPTGKTKPTIDLISIGIVTDDNREYYAVSKEFNLREVWNRFDLVQQSGDARNIWPEGKKVYWLRENVLEPIYSEMFERVVSEDKMLTGDEFVYFTYNNFKTLLKRFGKTNKQIAEEVQDFCKPKPTGRVLLSNPPKVEVDDSPINFYSYFGDYDWVVFCWLFGLMKDLPNGFPYYCRDLKQTFDEKCHEKSLWCAAYHNGGYKDFEDYLLKEKGYPIQPKKAHHSLEDAKWNKKLHEFLQTIDYRE